MAGNVEEGQEARRRRGVLQARAPCPYAESSPGAAPHVRERVGRGPPASLGLATTTEQKTTQKQLAESDREREQKWKERRISQENG